VVTAQTWEEESQAMDGKLVEEMGSTRAVAVLHREYFSLFSGERNL